jgi:hypothetical protein
MTGQRIISRHQEVSIALMPPPLSYARRHCWTPISARRAAPATRLRGVRPVGSSPRRPSPCARSWPATLAAEPMSRRPHRRAAGDPSTRSCRESQWKGDLFRDSLERPPLVGVLIGKASRQKGIGHAAGCECACMCALLVPSSRSNNNIKLWLQITPGDRIGNATRSTEQL